MKPGMLLTFVLIFSWLSVAPGTEDLSTKDPRWKQLSHAYSYIRSQKLSLQQVARKYPDLAQEAKQAELEFEASALGEGARGAERELARILGNKWPDNKHRVTAKLQSFTEEQEYSRTQAEDFLADVRQRAKGDLPETILATLLSANQRFSDNPALEMTAGWKQTYSSKSHPKAKGVELSISYPLSWSKTDGSKPNIVQVFRNGAGHGAIVSNILLADLELPADYTPTRAELEAFFQPNEIKTMIPDEGRFVDSKEMVIGGLPAGMIVHDQALQRLDSAMDMRMTQFMTIYEGALFIVQFSFFKDIESKKSLAETQKHYLPTFEVIANTLVLREISSP